MREITIGKVTVDASFQAGDVSIIQVKTPVKTGNLRQGFDIDINGDISNDVEYADEIEFGTTTRPGRFMVQQSLQEIGERLIDRIVEQISNKMILDPIIININIKV